MTVQQPLSSVPIVRTGLGQGHIHKTRGENWRSSVIPGFLQRIGDTLGVVKSFFETYALTVLKTPSSETLQMPDTHNNPINQFFSRGEGGCRIAVHARESAAE
jgi:hypothetical protein